MKLLWESQMNIAEVIVFRLMTTKIYATKYKTKLKKDKLAQVSSS